MAPAGKSKRLAQTTRPVSNNTSGLGMDRLPQAKTSMAINKNAPNEVQIIVLMRFLSIFCFFLDFRFGTIKNLSFIKTDDRILIENNKIQKTTKLVTT